MTISSHKDFKKGDLVEFFGGESGKESRYGVCLGDTNDNKDAAMYSRVLVHVIDIGEQRHMFSNFLFRANKGDR